MLFSIGVAVAFSGPAGSNASPQTKSPDAAAVQRGRTQFGESCGFCHGADATGARGPDLVRSPLVAHDVNGDKLGDVIRQGRPDKGMPALSLTYAQISDIAAFLHSRATESIESSGVPSDYPVERMLTGNAEAGKVYFNGPGRCKDCHSVTGDLAGIAKKYSSIEVESRMLYPGSSRRTCTVTLSDGKRVHGELKHLDDFVLVMKDEAGWYRSFSRDQVEVDLQDPLAAHRELLEKISSKEIHNLFAYIESLK